MNMKLPQRIDISPLLASKPCSPIPPPSVFSSRATQPQILTQPQQYLPTQFMPSLAPLNQPIFYQTPQHYNTAVHPHHLPSFPVTNHQPQHYYHIAPPQPQPQQYLQQRTPPFQHFPTQQFPQRQSPLLTIHANRVQSPPKSPQHNLTNIMSMKPIMGRPASPKIQFKYASPSKQSRNLSLIREVSNSSGFHHHSFGEDNVQDKIQGKGGNAKSIENINNYSHYNHNDQLSPMHKITQLISPKNNTNSLPTPTPTAYLTQTEKTSQQQVTNSLQQNNVPQQQTKQQKKNYKSITNYIYINQENKEKLRMEEVHDGNDGNGGLKEKEEKKEKEERGDKEKEKEKEKRGEKEKEKEKRGDREYESMGSKDYEGRFKEDGRRGQDRERKESTDGQALSLMPIIQQQQQKQKNIIKQNSLLSKQGQSPKIPQFSLSSSQKQSHNKQQPPLDNPSRPTQSPSFSFSSAPPTPVSFIQNTMKQQNSKIAKMQKQYDKLKYFNTNTITDNNNINNNIINNNSMNANMNGNGNYGLPRVQKNSSEQNSAQDSIMLRQRRNDYIDTNQKAYFPNNTQIRYKTNKNHNLKNHINQHQQYTIPGLQNTKSQLLPHKPITLLRLQSNQKQYRFEDNPNAQNTQTQTQLQLQLQLQLQMKLKQKDLQIKNLKNQVWLMKLRENQLLATITKLQKLNKDQFQLIQHMNVIGNK